MKKNLLFLLLFISLASYAGTGMMMSPYLPCNGVTVHGTVIANQPVSGVTVSVPYSDGDGSAYSSETLNSVGVLGLTATRAAGNFASGSCYLLYTITGTPSSAGTAYFTVSLPGSICYMAVDIAPNTQSGTISSLSCGSETNNGVLTGYEVATGVSSSIPYTGGNGGYYAAQSISSMGVTGLTASISAGLFSNGSGSLTYSITGTPSGGGTASFALNIGGQTCTLSRTVVLPLASISTLNCGSATNNGTLTDGAAASSVSSDIPYTGGNGGTYDEQIVTSNGVFGLTATLSAGALSYGSGTLTFNITGTPQDHGTAMFKITIGSQTCSLSRTVSLPIGTITALNCANAVNKGSLTDGTAASGVSSKIPYTGGDGGTYSAQSVGSTGVTGLTASLAAGTFATGSDTLTYTISGTPSGSGTAYFAISLGGQSCTLSRTVATSCIGSTTAVVEVTNSTTGRIWMDRNLGASQAATSSTDAASYGNLYQWGRGTDGHQCRNSSTTSTKSSSDQPANGDFIIESLDWRSTPNDNLWQSVSGANNPCPSGYRLPTSAEWNTERGSWGANINSIGAFGSALKLPVAGFRDLSDGSLSDVGSSGSYWSSTVNVTNARLLTFDSGNAYILNNARAFGFSVRCIKEQP